MTDSKLRTILHPIVQEYGLGLVLKSLGQIADTPCDRIEQSSKLGTGGANTTRQRRPRVTATEYVEKMELPKEKFAAVVELARRFQQKSFLPTFGDITDFCQVYEIQVPASRSRASAITRIFKFIANMETGDIQQMLDDGMFTGPSRLEPIADAILNYSGGVAYPDRSLDSHQQG